MSQITTHVLDTSMGRPAAGITVILFRQHGDQWKEMSKGITNADGRVSELLNKDIVLLHGCYKLKFEVSDYFDRLPVSSFYSFIEIIFNVTSPDHYHIPLLLNPFGYTTYRGS